MVGDMKQWNEETEARPAPVFLAVVCGILIQLAMFTKFNAFYAAAIISGLFSLQITIWRAVKALKDDDKN